MAGFARKIAGRVAAKNDCFLPGLPGVNQNSKIANDAYTTHASILPSFSVSASLGRFMEMIVGGFLTGPIRELA